MVAVGSYSVYII